MHSGRLQFYKKHTALWYTCTPVDVELQTLQEGGKVNCFSVHVTVGVAQQILAKG